MLQIFPFILLYTWVMFAFCLCRVFLMHRQISTRLFILTNAPLGIWLLHIIIFSIIIP